MNATPQNWPEPWQHQRWPAHPELEQRYARLIAQNTMPHALLLLAPSGSGKRTFAFRLARRLLHGVVAESGGLFADAVPTANLSIPDDSQVMRLITAGAHPDCAVVQPPAGKSRKLITVDDIRDNVIGFLHKTSSANGWRVVIIASADRMNKAAANALLKILEEPPPRVLLVLTAESRGRLPVTILSRCRLETIPPMPAEIMQQTLRADDASLTEAELTSVTALAGGRLGLAYKLAAGGLEIIQEVQDCMNHSLTNQPLQHLEAVERLLVPDDSSLVDNTILAWIYQRALADTAGRYSPWPEIYEQAAALLRDTVLLNLDRRAGLHKVYHLCVRANAGLELNETAA